MPLTKPRRRASARERFSHLDALGGIELKAYVKRGDHEGSPERVAAAAQVAAAARIADLPRC